jgi:thiosulfate/3-mercaptopyruvate sulfurtransferase
MVGVLITVDELDALASQVRLIDVRFKLGDPSAGRAWFEAGHLPGAVFVDLDTELAEAPGLEGRHPLPGVERFVAAMSRAGVADDTLVVVYDDGGAGAARLWWLLRHFGHPNVSLLDGGIGAWTASGRPLESGAAATVPRTAFQGSARDGDYVDTAALRAALATGSVHLLDARARERWRGDVEPIDPVPGRIPSARSAPTADTQADGRFRSADDLRAYFEALGVVDGKPIVVACGSGVSACVDLVALELAGIAPSQLYPASYSGWLAHGLEPARGDDPPA